MSNKPGNDVTKFDDSTAYMLYIFGMAYHEDIESGSLKALSQKDNIHEETKEEQGGEDNKSPMILKPKGPRPAMAKAFDTFLEKLAKELGISTIVLKNKGYRCLVKGDMVQVFIPNAVHKKLFLENLTSQKLINDFSLTKKSSPSPSPFKTRPTRY